jgi:hypothetical protein
MAIIKTLLKGCLHALQGFLLMGPLFTQFSRPLNLVKISSMFSKFALAYLAMLVLLVIFVTFSYVGLFVFFLSLMAPFGITVLLPLLPVVCLVGLLAWWTGWVPHAVVASFGNLFVAGYLSTSTVAHFCAVFLAGKSPTQFLALGFEIFHPRLPAAEIEEIAATSPTLRERAICWLLVTAHEPVVGPSETSEWTDPSEWTDSRPTPFSRVPPSLASLLPSRPFLAQPPPLASLLPFSRVPPSFPPLSLASLPTLTLSLLRARQVRLAASGIANMLISLPNAEDKPFTHAFLKTLASAFNLMFQLLAVQNLFGATQILFHAASSPLTLLSLSPGT